MTSWGNRQEKRINKAKQLIQSGLPRIPGVWADFGCGDGIFTAALLSLLPDPSIVYAVDKNRSALSRLQRNIQAEFPTAGLEIAQGDFRKSLAFPPLDGFIMANALHFTHDHKAVLGQLITYLRPGGRMIVVEYNTRQGNFAVPHPLHESDFSPLTRELSLTDSRVLNKIPSSFLGEMYAGIAFKPI